MNWDIARGIIEFYKQKGEPEKALQFLKDLNIVDKDSKLQMKGLK